MEYDFDNSRLYTALNAEKAEGKIGWTINPYMNFNPSTSVPHKIKINKSSIGHYKPDVFMDEYNMGTCMFAYVANDKEIDFHKVNMVKKNIEYSKYNQACITNKYFSSKRNCKFLLKSLKSIKRDVNEPKLDYNIRVITLKKKYVDEIALVKKYRKEIKDYGLLIQNYNEALENFGEHKI